MVKVEGTIRRIICNKQSDSTPWMIAEIEQADGKKVTIRGKLSTNAECNDHIVGNFELQESIYGQQYDTKSIVHISPPTDKAAIMERMTNFAHCLGIRMTANIKAAIENLIQPNTDFWTALENADGPTCILPIKAKAGDYNERYKSEYVDSTDVEIYFQNLGLNWSDKKIRRALGYEEDCEDPDREPIPLSKVKEDPMIILGLPGITIKDVIDYLSVLYSLGLIDEDTMKIGTFIKNLLESEQRQNTCMITPDYIKPLREHPLFKRYINEYKNCIYRSTTFKQENTISVFVGGRVQSHPAPYLYAEDTEALIASLPPDEGKTPTADQCAAIAKIFREPLLLILGSAGTGKTTALRLLCRYILTYMIHHRYAVLFLAPTGKAVQRIKDSIANIEFSDTDNTMTIHRFANIVKMDKWFQEIPKIVVIDEAIMVDNEAMFLLVDSLYKLISDDALMPHIVFIGDDGQLQPVGCGNPIMDLIKSGAVPIHRLQQIHRHHSESLLLDAVTALREGRTFTSTDDTFRIVDITEKTMKPIILKWIDDHPGDMNAVIVPTNHLMNTVTSIIREHINPVSKNPTIKLGTMDYKFRKGDKIMQIKNNYERCVFNGTCGYIVDVIKKTQESTMSDGKRASVLVYNLHVKFNGMKSDFYYTVDDSYKELALAYAFTTHKAQGSEYDHVLILMDKPIPGFINRNLIYTAASRGKKTVTIGLQQNSIRRQWRDMPIDRITNLVSMIDANVEYEV